MSVRTSPSVLAAEGEHGPGGGPAVPPRRGTSDPPADGGGQRPDAVPPLLRLRTVPAVPGRHRSPSLAAERALVCQVKTLDAVYACAGCAKGAVGGKLVEMLSISPVADGVRLLAPATTRKRS